MSKQVCVIEIGSSKVIALIAKKNGNELIISGIGTCGYSSGYKYDTICCKINEYPDEKDLYNAIRRAVAQAEHDAGTKITSVVAAVNAPFLKTLIFTGERSASSKNKFVTEEDEMELGSISLQNTEREGYVYIHSTPICYYLDGTEYSELPIGKKIEASLAADISHVFLDEKMAKIIDSCLSGLGIQRTDFVATPLAEAHYLIPGSNSERNAVLLDVGYLHSDMSFIRNEAIEAIDVLPCGGIHFTTDIMAKAHIPESNAEMIKKRFNFDLDYTGAKETVKTGDGEVKYIDKTDFEEAVKARMDDICDFLLDHLEDHDVDIENTPVYVTGGGLMMENCLQYLADHTGINVVQNYPKISREQLNTSNNISAFAVASFVANLGYTESEQTFGEEETEEPKSFLRRLLGI